jgi:LPPG:FO 2-phospho-L-lactate transferase
VEALTSAQRIIVAPSNPFLSIDPILAIAGVRDILRERRRDVIAVSPLIAGAAVKGPADRLMAELGHDVSAAAVASYYRDFVGTFVSTWPTPRWPTRWPPWTSRQ